MPLRDDLVERAKARVGAVLNGKWRLDRVIGIGGMATVYAATHRNQKRVAIKLLHPEVSLDKQVTMRFTREGYVANTVGHRAIVSVLDDDIAEDGSAFLVMELLEGETLDALRERRGTLSAGEVLVFADQILDVLAAAHPKGILHRDLKPENLFLTTEGHLKVLDFGIARLRELAGGDTAGSTRSGSLLGTPAFMAPEQARGRWQDVDERADIWAVGATMYTLLTGRFVHESETVNEQLIDTATKPAASIAKLLPLLPAEVVRVVDRALSYERADRWPSARAFQEAVREVMPLLGSGPFTATPPTPFSLHHEPTVVAPYAAAISADTNHSGTLTTGRPFMSELGTSLTPKRRGVWAGAGILALVLVGAGAYVARRPHLEIVTGVPPEIRGGVVPFALAPTSLVPDPAPQSLPPAASSSAAPAASAVADAKSLHEKAGKTAKPSGKAPQSPPLISTSGELHAKPPPAEGPPAAKDLFEKRH